MNDLIAFLRARYDEDEQVARAASGEVNPERGGSWRTGERWDSGRVEDVDGNVVAYDEGSPTEEEARHIARWDPARVLAEVEAKRRILDEYEDWRASSTEADDPVESQANHDISTGLEIAVELLTLPYAGHPEYRAEWRPDDHA